MRDPHRGIYFCCFSEQIYLQPYAFSRKRNTLITHTAYTGAHTHTNFALCSPPPLSLLPSLNLPDSNGSVSERRSGLWCIFSMILSFQIKGLFVFKLTKSSDGLRQRANILKCLSRSICVMAELSAVCMHWPFFLFCYNLLCHSAPAIVPYFLYAVLLCFLLCLLLFRLWWDVLIKGWGLLNVFTIVCICFISTKVSSSNYFLQANNPHSYHHGNSQIGVLG